MRYRMLMLGCCAALCAGQATAAGPGLDWLAGSWCGGDTDRRIEELWLPEAAGALLGMSRTTRGSKSESFEFMRLVVGDDSASFHVQPNGAPPTVFTQSARGEGWIRFENPAHDFPNRIEYRREGEALKASIAGPGRDGKQMQIPFEYRRCSE